MIPMFKNWELALYFLTAFFCMVMGINGGMADEMSDASWFVSRRIMFYIPVAVLLTIVFIRCGKLLKKYDSDYFERTEKLLHAAETCFVLVIVVTVFAVVGAIPTFIMLPKKVFFEGSAAGLFALLGLTGVTWAFHYVTSNQYHKVIKQREETEHPLGEKTEDFYAFIHGLDEKHEEDADPVEMPDVSSLLDESVPDEDEFNRHLQIITLMSHVSDPAELWECPLCGSLNSADSEQCDFCGGELNRKAEHDA